MLFIKSHINKEKIIKSPQKFKTPDPKVQIPAKNSNFQFKFPKNSPLKFKSTPKIPTFAPGSKKNITETSNSWQKIPTFATGTEKKYLQKFKFFQKIQLSLQNRRQIKKIPKTPGKSPDSPQKLP